MNVTQTLVNAAKREGFTMRSQALYERRQPDERFNHAGMNATVVFTRENSMGMFAFLTHKMARDLIQKEVR